MELISFNPKREELLAPLLEWRILGVQELSELSSYSGSPRGMRKMIERAERDGLLKSFIHKMSNRKFVYLSRRAYRELTDAPWNVNEDIKMHDAIVGSLLYRFSNMDNVEFVKINDQNISFNESIFSHRIDPDGMVRAKRCDESCNIAIEVELTRKNSTEIIRKFQTYHENTVFDWCIYFFNSMRTLEAYFGYFDEFRIHAGIKIEDVQILFCYSSDMAQSHFDPRDSTWIRPDRKSSTLRRFFYD